jgi:hypothetical protein
LRARLAELAADAPKSAPWLSLAAFAAVVVALAAALAVMLLRLHGSSFGSAQNEPRLVPDSRLTPGAVVVISEKQVCSTGAARERFIPAVLAGKVFASYGIRRPHPRQYEVDYLIDPELGGATDSHNLWPQPYSTVWNAHVKDALEDRLRDLVCSGAVSLPMAQHDIATNWIAAYQKYFKSAVPLPAHYAFAKDPPWDP